MRYAEWLNQVKSTNDLALTFARVPSIAVPLLIGADLQTAGRGRGAHQWWSAEGSLMFSIIVDMPGVGLRPADWPRFSLVTGLAIADALSLFLPSARIGLKWPNDVWLDGRKVCGILIEQSDLIPDRLIVGIGLNVNNSFNAAPHEQRQTATSMIDASHGNEFCRTEILIAFLNEWESLIEDLSQGRLNLPERWSRRCVLAGHPVTLSEGDRETIGVCSGIDDDGALLLRTEFATEKHYAGTVRRM